MSNTLDEAYKNLTVTVIGGVGKADYERMLYQLGFAQVHTSFDKKDIRQLPSLISGSDIAVVVGSCCSHDQFYAAKRICSEKRVPLISVPGPRGPQSIAYYLIENYARIRPQIGR